MDFNINGKAIKKAFDTMFPFGIVGFLFGIALALVFVAFSEVFTIILLIIILLVSYQTFLRVSKKTPFRVANVAKEVVAPWLARKPCPECGSKTRHKAGCSKKMKP